MKKQWNDYVRELMVKKILIKTILQKLWIKHKELLVIG